MEYGTTRAGSCFRDAPPLVHEESLFRASNAASRNGASLRRGDAPDRRGTDTPPDLRELVDVLRTPAGLKMFKIAYRSNMQYKVSTYGALHREAEIRAAKEEQVLAIKTPQLKEVAGASGDQDNWSIFDSIGVQYREAKDRASRFEALRIRAEASLGGSMGLDEVRPTDHIRTLRDELVAAITELANFTSQPHVVRRTVEIVASFLKDPSLFREKMMNFMLMGGAGTGKTTLAQAMSRVFAKAGIFVGDQTVEAGRGELVGQYEGQTVARTTAFLIENLDNGVVFIDEAYAITPWSDGKPEGYGSEAATAMVEFMTRYKGLYCIIVAGYETQMVRYFLATNEGLSRRFPNKYVLNNSTPDELIVVFLRQLLKQQALPVPSGNYIASAEYFSAEAVSYLRDLVRICTAGKVEYREEYDPGTRRTYRNVRSFKPDWDMLYAIFENQAGAMTNIAEEALSVLMANVSFQDVIASQKKNLAVAVRLLPPRQPKETMRLIVERSIARVGLSDTDLFLAQLREVESLI
jgi:DNA replication protein DnaC